MRFSRDDDAALWLRDFVPEFENFDWGAGNRTKNEKHGVRPEEIESIFFQERFVFAGKITEPAHDEWRGLILGCSDAGRLVALIFTRRGERLRPISCRSMRPNERRLYETSTQEHS
ncbi:MAG TPA: BrnT family toxin [Elusimicrobiota bacterium]|jgi:uncharacterized DUF497 family protein|nr:BrnT family toxin [Elusimicrobiota bacterium]